PYLTALLNLVENTGFSDSYEGEEDSSVSPVSISSENKDHSHMKDVKENEAKSLVPYRTTARWRPEDDNTSDEDQEELPYDGELHHHHMFHAESPKESLKEVLTMNETDQRGSGVLHTLSKVNAINNTDQPMVGVDHGQEPRRVSGSIPDFLLRHFSRDELLNCSRLIEAETMPEVSLLDSIDETALSRASTNLHTTSGVGGHSTKVKANLSLLEESSRDESHTASVVTDSKMRSTETATQRNKNADQLVQQSDIPDQSDFTVESTVPCISNTDASPVNLAEEEKEDEEENAQQSCSASTPNLSKADVQSTRYLLGRTRSCNELKYGQGQVHYPLPDFSKVAPKVKIPKGNGPTKPGCHTPSADRTHTTAGILGKSPSSCTADVISRVLEDSVWLTEMKKDEENQSKLDQHLQSRFRHTQLRMEAEYNRLLARCAEDDNLINPMTLRDQMFKSMMEAQDQLERHYMSKKEEHRLLEMQNYMGLDRNTGQFDPDSRAFVMIEDFPNGNIQFPPLSFLLISSSDLAIPASPARRPASVGMMRKVTGACQRFVSPETDSGLGSSDQSRPPTGLSLIQYNTDSSEAISALQHEVSRLKRALEESLCHLPHLSMRVEHLSSMYSQEKRLRSRPRSRHQHRPPSSSFKVNDHQSDPEVSRRRRSTQSDTAMLPSNVYFQRTSPLPTSPGRSRGRSRSQRVKEEAINRTLDKALEAAFLMKQTTDRMAKTLSADLAKAQIYRKLHRLHPLSDMEQP
ncbi:hypothetical protein NFI96_001414, partial [Prochilodus magdalenae]